MPDDPADARADAGPSRAQRALVLGALAILLVGGLGGIEAWPVTGWRLFSHERGPVQSGWVLQTTDARGGTEPLSFGELPLAYRMGTWELADAVRDPTGAGAEVCGRLLAGARERRPEAVGLRVLRDRQRMVRGPDEAWVRTHDARVVLTCGEGA
jgi:hypothetical protein